MPEHRSLDYQPALDGLRAVAVVMVLLFHGEFSWMRGGYLGVSVFFTLSGFLITSLLLAERERTGSVSLGSFYSRRAKRLLPASLLCLVGVCLLAAANAFRGVDHIRRDALGALLQVFNWVKLSSGETYADVAAAQTGLRKPLEHYWSLAIEEQFYWLWPLAFLGLAALARRHSWSLTGLFTGLFVVAAGAAPIIAQVWGSDAAYWATPARAAEILAGAVVAGLTSSRRLPAAATWLAPACFGAIVVAAVITPSGRGPAYQGALPLFALLSAGLIVGLQQPGSARALLSTRPFVAVGKVSYGVYLYHWPVFVLIDRQRWALPAVAEFTVKLVITAAVTVASYWMVERPVRTASWLPPRRTLWASAGALAAVAALMPIVPGVDRFYVVDEAKADAAAIDTAPVAPLPTLAPATSAAPTTAAVGTAAPAPSSSAATTTVALAPPRPVRILVVGDSTAEATGAGLVDWAAANPDLAQVSIETAFGCPLTPGGWVVDGDERDIRSTCSPWSEDEVPARIAALKPDVVMFMTSAWDVTARRLVKDGPLLDPTIAEMADAIRAAFERLSAQALANGASRVVWIRHPIPDPLWWDQPLPGRDPARHQVLYDIMADIAASNAQVRVADMVGEMQARGWLDDQSLRPDGSHFDLRAATMVATEWLGPLLVREALT
jgi:peptidoglycan/LPS O-acetylase OafA/YrhL